MSFKRAVERVAIEALAPVFSRSASVLDYDKLRIEQARDKCYESPEFTRRVMKLLGLACTIDGFFHKIECARNECADFDEYMENSQIRAMLGGYSHLVGGSSHILG